MNIINNFGTFVPRLPCFQGRPIRNPNPLPSPSHCRVMSQDPSSRCCYPPLGGIRSRSSQQSVFGCANATDLATGAGLLSLCPTRKGTFFGRENPPPQNCSHLVAEEPLCAVLVLPVLALALALKVERVGVSRVGAVGLNKKGFFIGRLCL